MKLEAFQPGHRVLRLCHEPGTVHRHTAEANCIWSRCLARRPMDPLHADRQTRQRHHVGGELSVKRGGHVSYPKYTIIQMPVVVTKATELNSPSMILGRAVWK